MNPEDAPNRESIIEAIVLAFSHSKLKAIVGSDALRSVLAGQYRDMVSGKQLHLQVVWDLIHDQPGYDEEHAKPAFCALKTWEKNLRLEVVLPASLSGLSDTEIVALGSHCGVPSKDRHRVLGATGSIANLRESRASIAPVVKPSSSSANRPGVVAALALVAAAAMGFTIYTLVGLTSRPAYQRFNTDEISSILPVKSAKRLGADLSVVLEDDAWLEQPHEAMTADLHAALTALKDSNVEILILQDTSGAMRASAQWVGSPARIEVRLP